MLSYGQNTSNLSNSQENLLFSLPEPLSSKKVEVDFSSPDISSNGGLALLGSMKGAFAEKIASCIPDYRNEFFISHTYREMVCQRIGQILCGYEDANDCNLLRGDSPLKMSVGRLPSGKTRCNAVNGATVRCTSCTTRTSPVVQLVLYQLYNSSCSSCTTGTSYLAEKGYIGC